MKDNLVQFPLDRIVRRMPPDPKRGWQRFKRYLVTFAYITAVVLLVVVLVIAFNGLFA